MTNTIDEHQFRLLCREVRREAPTILQHITEPSRRTASLLKALFERVCTHLKIDRDTQAAELGDDDGFALFQTLDKHMQPEFSYSAILDRELLFGLQ